MCLLCHNTVIKCVLKSPQSPMMQTIIREGGCGRGFLSVPCNAVQTLRKFCLCVCMCVVVRSGFGLCWMLTAAEPFPDVIP